MQIMSSLMHRCAATRIYSTGMMIAPKAGSISATSSMRNAWSPLRGYSSTADSEDTAGQPQTPEQQQAALLAEKDKQLAQLQDSYRRALAEMENIRTRTKKEVEAASQFAIQKFAKDLLETSDVLKLALNSVPESERPSSSDSTSASSSTTSNPHLKNLFEGVSLTHANLVKTFSRHGIEEVVPLNEKFDPNVHQALFQAPIPGKEPGTIFEVTKSGYKLHGRILRPAQVGVVQ